MTPLEAARALAPQVEAARATFDRDRRLPVSLVDAMAGAGLFQAWLPRDLGGGELDPLTLLAVAEELGRQDGSAGWCAVIAGGYSRLGGAMAPAAARALFGTGRGILVGSLNPTGRAVAAPGGFRVTGRWSYGSFIAHGDWVLGNCLAGDAPGPDGGPPFLLCLFPKAAVDVIDVWDVGGLRGTGSDDYAVTDLFVPEAFAIPFPGFHPPPVAEGALYRVPLPSTFVCCIAAVMLGIARAAIETVIEIGAAKTTAGSGPVLRERPLAQADLALGEATLRSGHAYLWDALGQMWDDVRAGRPVSVESRAQVRLAAVHAGRAAVRSTDIMYQLAGGASLPAGSRLDRCLRDVHAAGQHVVMSPQAYMEALGRVLFGLPPGMARF